MSIPAPRRLLVVDPSSELCAYVRDGVSDLGVAVFEAGDGYDALRQAGSLGADLVLANHRLRGVGGLELAHRLAERGGPPVVVMGPVSEAEAREAGARGVLPKPFDRAELRRVVTQATQVTGATEPTADPLPESARRGLERAERTKP